jgi:hypothetical protein
MTVSIVPDRTARQLPGLSLRRLQRRSRRDSRRGPAINQFQSANNFDSATAQMRSASGRKFSAVEVKMLGADRQYVAATSAFRALQRLA